MQDLEVMEAERNLSNRRRLLPVLVTEESDRRSDVEICCFVVGCRGNFFNMWPWCLNNAVDIGQDVQHQIIFLLPDLNYDHSQT